MLRSSQTSICYKCVFISVKGEWKKHYPSTFDPLFNITQKLIDTKSIKASFANRRSVQIRQGLQFPYLKNIRSECTTNFIKLFVRTQYLKSKKRHCLTTLSEYNTPKFVQKSFYYVTPLYTEVKACCFTCVRSVLPVSLCLWVFYSFRSSTLSIVQAVKHETLTQC